MGFFKNPLKSEKKIFKKLKPPKPGSDPLGLGKGGGGGSKGTGAQRMASTVPAPRTIGTETSALRSNGRASGAPNTRAVIATKPMTRPGGPNMATAGAVRTTGGIGAVNTRAAIATKPMMATASPPRLPIARRRPPGGR